MPALRPRFRNLAAAVSVLAVLSSVLAAPVAARTRDVTIYTSQNADATYVSDLDMAGTGVHATFEFRYSNYLTQTRQGATTEMIVQVNARGWTYLAPDGGMINAWFGTYERIAIPADRSLGRVDPLLGRAFLDPGLLTFVCGSADQPDGQCPPLPQQIAVTGTWTATGGPVTSITHEVDSIGTQIWTLITKRDATPSFQISGGTLPVPAILQSSFISLQVQTNIAP